MRMFYETPMIVDGVPPRSTSLKKNICKRVGRFELDEVASSAVRPVAGIRHSVHEPITVIVDTGETGLAVPVMALSADAFGIGGAFPAIKSRLDTIISTVRNTPKLELDHKWSPSSLGRVIHDDRDAGVARIGEIEPSRYGRLDRRHYDREDRSIVAELARHLTDGETVYRRCPTPFLSVERTNWGSVAVEVVIGETAEDFAERRNGIVALFGLAELDEARSFARQVSGLPAGQVQRGDHLEIEVSQGRPLSFDTASWSVRSMGEILSTGYASHVHSLGIGRSLRETPPEATALARDLEFALRSETWAADLDVMESAIEACMDYDAALGADRPAYFTSNRDLLALAMDRWAARPISLSVVPGLVTGMISS